MAKFAVVVGNLPLVEQRTLSESVAVMVRSSLFWFLHHFFCFSFSRRRKKLTLCLSPLLSLEQKKHKQMTYMMLLPSAVTPTEQALLTRAFFMQSSEGSFNSLFTGEFFLVSFLLSFLRARAPRKAGSFFLAPSFLSFSLSQAPFLFFLFRLAELTLSKQRKNPTTGNGYTATGVGAVFAGESTEFLFSPFFSKSLPPKARTTIQFCLNGVNGGVPINGDCKTLTPPAP
jgi:hypothetical protein